MTGLVRPPRRPLRWRAPGPHAPPQAPSPSLGPFDGEDLCYLAGDWRILQRIDGHRWSLDDLVTAWLAARMVAHRPPDRLLDLGCGIGTVLLLLAWRFPEARVTGVEAQALSADLAHRSIAWNGLADRCAVVRHDLRTVPREALDPPYALVTGTPPYLPVGTATASQRPQVAPAHLELRGGIEAYCTAAAQWLASDGVFVACEGAKQDARVDAAANAAGLHVVERVVVVPRAGKAPLFTVHAMRRAPERSRVGILTVRDADGCRSAGYRAVRAALGLPP